MCLCPKCGGKLTTGRCSLKYKCKIGTCSNQYPCRQSYHECSRARCGFRCHVGIGTATGADVCQQASPPIESDHDDYWADDAQHVTNYIGMMQEHLQMLAPPMGCRPDQMYDIESHGQNASFRARVVLLNTAKGYRGPMEMRWSSSYNRKDAARQDAACLALDELRASGARPHDSCAMPLAVGVRLRGDGKGVGPDLGDERDRAMVRNTAPRPATAALPELSVMLLSPEPVVCDARRAGAITADPADIHSGLGDLSLDLTFGEEVNVGGSERRGSGRVGLVAGQEVLDRVALSEVPTNLGQLGEEYAVAWLKQKAWVLPESVKWLNCKGEAHADHDIECAPTDGFARRHIEVKTRWRGAKATMSARQQGMSSDELPTLESDCQPRSHHSLAHIAHYQCPEWNCMCQYMSFAQDLH